MPKGEWDGDSSSSSIPVVDPEVSTKLPGSSASILNSRIRLQPFVIRCCVIDPRFERPPITASVASPARPADVDAIPAGTSERRDDVTGQTGPGALRRLSHGVWHGTVWLLHRLFGQVCLLVALTLADDVPG